MMRTSDGQSVRWDRPVSQMPDTGSSRRGSSPPRGAWSAMRTRPAQYRRFPGGGHTVHLMGQVRPECGKQLVAPRHAADTEQFGAAAVDRDGGRRAEHGQLTGQVRAVGEIELRVVQAL